MMLLRVKSSVRPPGTVPTPRMRRKNGEIVKRARATPGHRIRPCFARDRGLGKHRGLAWSRALSPLAFYMGRRRLGRTRRPKDGAATAHSWDVPDAPCKGWFGAELAWERKAFPVNRSLRSQGRVEAFRKHYEVQLDSPMARVMKPQTPLWVADPVTRSTSAVSSRLPEYRKHDRRIRAGRTRI
jgi:hypothetical protein